jgi:GntR family transcriptional repressor for pyruvate dehydrogenase complex
MRTVVLFRLAPAGVASVFRSVDESRRANSVRGYPRRRALKPASTLRLEAIEQPRAHVYVAEQLRREIALRLLDPATPLPPERELAQLFRVSRATVQQALAQLEAEGLVARRRGRGGGTFVIGQPTDMPRSAELLASLARNRRQIEEMLDFRLELEPAGAGLAAAAARPADLEAIEEAARLTEAAQSDAEHMRHDTEFHLAIARASGNRLFADAVESSRVVLNDVLPALPETALWHERSDRQHRTIVAALVAGDAARARRAMLTHVRDTDASVRALLAALRS